MSVILSPMPSRRMSVGAADDPYKKYWWVILGGFVLTGAWLCIPIMETPVGSVHVDTRAKAVDPSSSEQSLDAADNPSGAPGDALDLSMDGPKHKSKSGDGEDMTSMLYQAPLEPGAAAAAGKPLGDATAASASASLAQQLKDAGRKDAPGGWNEKPQRGFVSPHLAGASLSGVGSVGGGGSSASAGGGSMGAFGTRNASVGYESAKGLRDDGSAAPGFQALKAAAKSGPNLAGAAEAMKTASGQSFDGARAQAPATAAAGTGAMQQANALYDAAPADLKANDPKIDQKKLPDPPAAPTPQSNQQNMAQQMVMMVGMALVGGMVGGVAGQMIAMVGMQAMQMQQQQAAADAAAKQQQAVQKRMGTS